MALVTGGASSALQAVHNFTAAQVRSLFTDSPVTLVAAPGAGKLILPRSVVLIYTFGTLRFFSASGSGSQGNLAIGTTTISVIQNQSSALAVRQTFSVADSLVSAGPPPLNASSSQIVVISVVPTNDPTASVTGTMPLSAWVNKAFTFSIDNGNLTNGQIATSTIQAAGSGYAIGDTLADDGSWGNGDLLATVNTVDGSGHVLTYTITNVGTSGWSVGNGGVNAGQSIAFSNVAPQSGAGTGFIVKVASINQGDGTLRLVVDYEVLSVV